MTARGARRLRVKVGELRRVNSDPARIAELEAVLDRGLIAMISDEAGFHGLITRTDLLNHLRRKLK